MDGPDQIGPDLQPKRSWREKTRRMVKTFTTREGLVGDYDYAYLFTPNLPFINRGRKSAPFFGLEDKVPVLLALLLGLQHALAMLGGVISPPILIGGTSGANFGTKDYEYLVSTSLIVSGLLSAVQMARFHVYKTRFYVGTGLISVVGTSFATITVSSGTFNQMYTSGYCPVDSDGNRLPCPKGYGALLGTSCLCSLLEIGLSFMSPRILKRIFPPLVTGPTILLIGASLIQSSMEDWAGGSGTCFTDAASRALCPSADSPHALPWGSPEFIGLGFSVFVTIILCERFGAPMMKSCAVIIGLLVGCIIAAACGYFDRSSIDAAPVASFIWVRTFPLTIYAPLILPLLAVYIVVMMESIGDITATCDVSQVEVEGPEFDSRVQGGVLGNGFTCLLAGLCTITPMSVFAQNNGVIALTKCANRKAGYCCCFFLVIMGIFAKFAAALTSIPSAVLGGMTTFLFSSVAISGVRIIATVPFTRRNRFVLTASFSIGMGVTLVPTWFSYFFTYSGNNRGLTGLLDAIDLVMNNGFAITAILGVILNLIIPEEADEGAAVVEARAEPRAVEQPDDPENAQYTKGEHPSGVSAV
ncbi:nucleobase:cation symporter-2 family protein [Aspergillus brunneoviolaceus CBS 621.78]|uniref:Xanthine/uracil permease n=1 Tax=Aspergillus brunneoviolaceus CBS 621.78 TaxID=1450534 RepID=A0ACD1FWQ1_9EURO|nr:Xanthine/uracil permease [Aspergillus brunneoviolaceus CBS 621.78]RAH41393.1 Xanthine/uracil permease [Aspergillus brunneoviolaceus CBS 621.78]